MPNEKGTSVLDEDMACSFSSTMSIGDLAIVLSSSWRFPDYHVVESHELEEELGNNTHKCRLLSKQPQKAQITLY